MKLTIEQQAALGRMGYAIRATVTGLRMGEDFDLVLRAVMHEAINLALTKYSGSMPSGQAEIAEVSHTIFQFLALNNPNEMQPDVDPIPDDSGDSGDSGGN